VSLTSFERLWQTGRKPPERAFPEFGHRLERVTRDIVCERDLAIPMRDGVKLYADVFRPVSGAAVPALLTWSPYGKHAPQRYERYYQNGGVLPQWLSKYSVFEGPDPLAWVPRGYAVVHVDSRGTWRSEGEAAFLDRAEGRDGYDAVEFIAAQSWCTGRVGLAGVSYLATVQWQIAATRPPHLAAINVWEGASDLYREFFLHGGIPETSFVPRWNANRLNNSLTRVEDLAAMVRAHPLWDAYWETKRAQLSNIDVPAYIVASWSDQGLHTRGTLEGFREIGSREKWLEIHGRKKWQYYHQPASVEKQRRFFDQFLRGVPGRVQRWPSVLIEVRERFYKGRFRAEREWPLARTQYRPLYLGAGTGRMKTAPYIARTSVSYEAPGDGTRSPASYGAHRAEFGYRFARATELTGHMKLKLWVEAEGSTDMDLFVAIQKFDRAGRHVGFPVYNAFEDGPIAMGWLRVSHRELDAASSTPWQPRLLHRRRQMLKPRQIVPVEIEIWPSSTRFAAGEWLRVAVQGSDIYTYPGAGYGHTETVNRGRHIIHTGGRFDSHLLVPVIPSRVQAKP